MIKVKIQKSSDWRFTEYKEFNNEKEMIDYGLSMNHSGNKEIIISKFDPEFHHRDDPIFDYEMEIYDGYRE
jgi:hypothetical protein